MNAFSPACDHPRANRSSRPDVLGELLHSLSQPLTSLRCSLELSIDDVPEQQQRTVSAALQQTEKVIGMIQLMREYLEAEHPALEIHSTALAPTVRSVIEELSSIAAVRDIRLRLVGTCSTAVAAPELRLRLALQYLVASMIEALPPGGKVICLLGEGPAGAVLRAESERGPGVTPARHLEQIPTRLPMAADADRASSSAQTLRQVRLSIASRVLESAGASLVFGDSAHGIHPAGFVLRVPRRDGVST